ncbi:hypothetical protein QFZ51_004401 [Chitinophaga sp. W3I9]
MKESKVMEQLPESLARYNGSALKNPCKPVA